MLFTRAASAWPWTVIFSTACTRNSSANDIAPLLAELYPKRMDLSQTAPLPWRPIKSSRTFCGCKAVKSGLMGWEISESLGAGVWGEPEAGEVTQQGCNVIESTLQNSHFLRRTDACSLEMSHNPKRTPDPTWKLEILYRSQLGSYLNALK